MNRFLLLILCLLAITQLSCAAIPSDGPRVTVDTFVVDDLGVPLEGATVTGGFRSKDTGTPAAIDETNEFGRASISGHAPFGSIRLIIEKEDFYTNVFERIDTTERNLPELAPRSREVNTTLRRRLDPIPLIAKHVKELEIPLENDWVGYDLVIGDWKKPYGKGERGDILFRFNNKFLGYRISETKLNEIVEVAERLAKNRGEKWTEEKQKQIYGDWSGQLDIRFPSEKEGIISVDDSNGYIAESEMRMPHLAPVDDYEKTLSWDDVRNGQFMPKKGNGFFLRVRVRERNDQIIEANYAKINLRPYGAVHDGLRFDPRGKISFTYYFNPDVNNRNLEFDPGKNLLKNLDSSEEVKLP